MNTRVEWDIIRIGIMESANSGELFMIVDAKA